MEESSTSCDSGEMKLCERREDQTSKGHNLSIFPSGRHCHQTSKGHNLFIFPSGRHCHQTSAKLQTGGVNATTPTFIGCCALVRHEDREGPAWAGREHSQWLDLVPPGCLRGRAAPWRGGPAQDSGKISHIEFFSSSESGPPNPSADR